MMAWVLFDESGTIPVGASNGVNQPSIGYVSVDVGNLTPLQVMQHYLADGAWSLRPVLGIPAVEGTTYVFAVPDGATCDVIDAETGANLGTAIEVTGVIELTFADSGSYRLEFTLPPEWIPASRKIEIE